MSKAVIGLGTNLGDRVQNLQFAVDALRLVPKVKVTAASAVYKTAPVGYADQPDFYNAVLLLETELSAAAVLGTCLGIEAAAGRIRSIKNGPRVLDMDVLLYEGERCDTPELILPHPRMTERGFVLVPLEELFPDGVALGLQFDGFLRQMDTSDIRKTDHTLTLED